MSDREGERLRERKRGQTSSNTNWNKWMFCHRHRNQVGFGTGASEVPKAQLASLKCMVQTVRILNIDWVCLNGSPRLTWVVRCATLIFIRHVFICIYYCFAYNLLCRWKMFVREMRIYWLLPLSFSRYLSIWLSFISVSVYLAILLPVPHEFYKRRA